VRREEEKVWRGMLAGRLAELLDSEGILNGFLNGLRWSKLQPSALEAFKIQKLVEGQRKRT
jgi:hypothetical protein